MVEKRAVSGNLYYCGASLGYMIFSHYKIDVNGLEYAVVYKGTGNYHTIHLSHFRVN